MQFKPVKIFWGLCTLVGKFICKNSGSYRWKSGGNHGAKGERKLLGQSLRSNFVLKMCDIRF